MRLAATIELFAYGTPEGVEKAWDTRGRGKKAEEKFEPKTDIERGFIAINKMYREVEIGEPDEVTLINARDAATDMLEDLRQENKHYFGYKGERGKVAKQKDKEYSALLLRLRSTVPKLTDIDQAVNTMHIDYPALRHRIWENEHRLEKTGMDDDEVDERSDWLGKMSEGFQLRRGATAK